MEDIDGPDLTEGQEVEFDVEYAEKGPRAMNLRRDPTDPSGGGGDSTDVYEEGGSSEAADGTPTEVYGEEEPDSTDVFDEGSPDFCPNCGEGLAAYPDPDFCPGCGNPLSPDG
jgi:hypothetical protein